MNKTEAALRDSAEDDSERLLREIPVGGFGSDLPASSSTGSETSAEPPAPAEPLADAVYRLEHLERCHDSLVRRVNALESRVAAIAAAKKGTP